VARITTLTLALFLVASLAVFGLQDHTHAAASGCDALLGKWVWFTKGVVTFNPDGTMVHEPGNYGTWECTDAAWGRVTLRWHIGGYVNRLALSTDGKGLFSTDPSQAFVTAKRVGVGTDGKAWKESQAKASGKEQIEDHDVSKTEPAPKTADKARQPEGGSSQQTPRLRWKFETGKSYLSPAVAEGVVYVSSDDRYLFAIEATSGKKKWAFQLPRSSGGSPTVAHNIVYVCAGSSLYAVDIKTGRQLWELEFTNDGIIGTTPTVANGVIFLGAGGLRLSKNSWYLGPSSESMAGAESKHIWGLIAVDAKTGRRKLGIPTARFDSAPVVADGVVYVGSRDGHLHAVESSFDPKIRRTPTIWKFKTGDSITSSVAVADGVVYVGSKDGHLYAVDVKTHQEKWRFKAGLGWSAPVIAAGVIYVSNADGQLYAVDTKTGREKWKFKAGDKILSSPAVADGVVYIGSNDTHLYAVDTKSGHEKWRFKTGGKVFSSPVVADGMVYVGSDDGYLYAIIGSPSSPPFRVAATQANKQRDQSVTPEDSREIARIVEGLSQNYKGGLYFHWLSGNINDDSHIRKGQSLTIGEGLTLVKRYLECSMPNPNWLSADDPRAKYRMSGESAADCDKRRHGLKWEEKSERAPLAQIRPSSVSLSKTDKGGRGSDLSLTFEYEDRGANDPDHLTFEKDFYKALVDKLPPGFTAIECKDHITCGQMAADLKKLVEIARKSASSKKTSSPESTAKGAEQPRHVHGNDSQQTAKVDPALVGMWKLAHPGLNMYWQNRADGTYRFFGVSARPLEHWGTIEASGGHWATQWAGGQDGGSYTLSDNIWQATGNAGTGNWQRVWKPGDGGSQVQCPLIDVSEVEALFGNATRGRGDTTSCTLSSSGVGYEDRLTITVIDAASERFANVRKQTSQMRPIIDIPGLGNAAFIDSDQLHILKGNRYAVITAKMYPDHPDAVSNAALIRLGRSVARRF
jgi:outer membrane protein assembly factor BamB